MSNSDNKSSNKIIPFVAIAAIVVVGVYLFASDGGDGGPGTLLQRDNALTYEDAVSELDSLVDEVAWSEKLVSQVSTVTETAVDLADTLPAISSFPLVVDVPVGSGVAAEIFVSSEKAGTGTDGWMVEAAEDFNGQDKTLKNGKRAKIKIRKIASGTGYQFIASGKYRPDGYSPSNHLWVRMAEAQGVAMKPVRETTVRNIAGIVMKSAIAKELEAAYGSVSVPNIVDAVVQGKIATGYTNPYASSTGLNFLVTVLATFAGNDEAKMLSPEVVSAFEGFQRGIPFVALTTLQMRDSVRRDGSLDAFVMEYQTFAKTSELKSGYEFFPFGLAHDNPLYAVANPQADTLEVLELFAEFLEQDKYKELASDYGFNPSLTHQAPFAVPSGQTLISAQRTWKEKKDAGRPIAAVFVSDVSGSMAGSRLRQLKTALLDGSGFIAPTNAIGLVQFSDDVIVILPIKPFELLQKSAFHAAVRRMDSGGGTAMYDGVAVAIKMLVEEKSKRPEIKPMVFVLTDGQTNRGLSFDTISPVVQGLRVPVYTIGFEADFDELARLSSLVEAASLKAGEADLRYKIGSLLNSQM